MVCRDKKVQTPKLATGINQLVESEDLKSRLAQLAHEVRALGNRGAHEWERLSKAEVRSAEALCRAVLEVVYSAPHLITQVTRHDT